jgi:hypothetical protein
LLLLSRTILILLLSLHVYNSFTLDCFTLLVVLPKNKIRSIINSFKLLNTELPWLLIFLYCSPGTFCYRFETLLFLLLWPGTNISNELLLLNSHPRLPGFPVWETGLRFIQTHHNYIYRV